MEGKATGVLWGLGALPSSFAMLFRDGERGGGEKKKM